MQTQTPDPNLTVEQALWEVAAEAYSEATTCPVIVPNEGCDCLGCNVARIFLLPFLPVTWH